MKITDIKRQAKRADRYSIFGDDKYLFSLSEVELLKTGIRINQEIKPEELDRLRQTALLDKALDRSLNLISRRPRSSWEMAQYLKQKGYEIKTIEIILNMLSEKGYLDDLDFAKRWIESRRLLKSTSKRRLTQELRAKRVSVEIIQEALDSDVADEQEILKELIKRKRSQTRYKDSEKLIAYLLRQGFNYGDIKEAIKES